MAEAKTKLTGESVKAFLDRVAEGEQRKDCTALVRLMKEAAKAPPKMWGASIVGFGTYDMTYAGGRIGTWPIVAFSPRKPHLTLYLSGFPERKALIDKLGKHRMSGGCLHIKRLSDVDQQILKRLVSGSVKEMKKKHG
jgi:Domain of unknown function (DU1801)